ncbi:hypothetical protein [Pseudonocardia charpentierae]|uniref:Uncharacterized protein n=1 Tax=Pseudonocardia charpentierae TaxID=3075545 RepID=A0ABU2N6P4_9PSEU|nr:hypothetical protein [Pseudonocardia sp. DSM 45834]MDT0349168.1 hypothetical protein [Pseudonocardia sp. DSM 45834]
MSYFPPPPSYPPHRPTHVVRNRWLIAVGIAVAIAFLAALLSVGESTYSDSGYSDSGYSDSGYSDSGYSDSGYSDSGYSDRGYSDESGNSQFYGDGENSIVTTDDGELIYSDDNGNSFSVGG